MFKFNKVVKAVSVCSLALVMAGGASVATVQPKANADEISDMIHRDAIQDNKDQDALNNVAKHMKGGTIKGNGIKPSDYIPPKANNIKPTKKAKNVVKPKVVTPSHKKANKPAKKNNVRKPVKKARKQVKKNTRKNVRKPVKPAKKANKSRKSLRKDIRKNKKTLHVLKHKVNKITGKKARRHAKKHVTRHQLINQIKELRGVLKAMDKNIRRILKSTANY